MKPSLAEDGFVLYEHDPQIESWANAAIPLAEEALNDQEQRSKWLLCEGTWFVGVEALATGTSGQAGEVPLAGKVISDLKNYLDIKKPMHRAQLSVVYPGYPKPRAGESDPAFNYRKNRDAAHVDGLHAIGSERRRHLSELHAFLLGIPLADCSPDASPLVVWKGSHKLVQAWLIDTLSEIAPDDWSSVDLTESYQALRQQIFQSCERVKIHHKLGETVVMHRHALHGIAPWSKNAPQNSHGRMIAYFRPEVSGDLTQWLHHD